jgi:hypothetical protein
MTEVSESEMRAIRNQALRYTVDLVVAPTMSFQPSSIGILKMADFYAQYIATGKIPGSQENTNASET